MPITWLRHAALQARYSCSRNTVDRLVDEQKLPPKSFPCGGRAPMWEQACLDAWDYLAPHERELILSAWPDWRSALAAIAAERTAEEPKPRRRKRKQRQQKRRRASAGAEASP